MAGTTKLMTAGGGGVALTPASSIASDVTVNVPSQDCTLGIQGPAFSATQPSQAINNAVSTKLQCSGEEFDTANCYDSSTNYRFTPNVAGYYQVNGSYYLNAVSGGCTLYIYKNGINAKTGSFSVATSYGGQSNVSALIYLNGTTDYIELYGYQTSGSSVTGSGAYFQAALVRAA